MKRMFFFLTLILMYEVGYCQKNQATPHAIIYNIMPGAAHYIDGLVTSSAKPGKKPFAVINTRTFNRVRAFLTYEVHIDFYPYENSMPEMLPIIKHTNRFLKAGDKFIPVVFEELDQVFAVEGERKEPQKGIVNFPQPDLIDGKIIIIDLERKRWKVEDRKDW